MSEKRYNVLVNGDTVAENLTIDIALVLVGALFEKYHVQAKEVGMLITVQALGEGVSL